MSFGQRLKEIREGFERPFWVANFTEIFERVAYYGTTAVLAIYLSEQLRFSSELTGWLVGSLVVTGGSVEVNLGVCLGQRNLAVGGLYSLFRRL